MEDLAWIPAEHPFCNGLETYYIDPLTSCASNVRLEKEDPVTKLMSRLCLDRLRLDALRMELTNL